MRCSRFWMQSPSKPAAVSPCIRLSANIRRNSGTKSVVKELVNKGLNRTIHQPFLQEQYNSTAEGHDINNTQHSTSSKSEKAFFDAKIGFSSS